MAYYKASAAVWIFTWLAVAHSAYVEQHAEYVEPTIDITAQLAAQGKRRHTG